MAIEIVRVRTGDERAVRWGYHSSYRNYLLGYLLIVTISPKTDKKMKIDNPMA